METGDANHGMFFAFKDDRKTWCDPSVVYLTMSMLQECKACIRTEQENQKHYAQDDALPIVPIKNMEGNRDINRMVMLPVKWMAELIDKNATPRNFCSLLRITLVDGIPMMRGYHKYLENWGLATCTVTNKKKANLHRSFPPHYWISTLETMPWKRWQRLVWHRPWDQERLHRRRV